MIKNFLLPLFLLPLVVNAQNKADFNHDVMRNQMLTEVCINCFTKNVKAFNELKEEDLQVTDQIYFYPNPVSEELFLTWKIGNEKKVDQVQLLSEGGKSMITFMPISNWLTMRFQGYVKGVYFVVFAYNNGDKKTIKILKK